METCANDNILLFVMIAPIVLIILYTIKEIIWDAKQRKLSLEERDPRFYEW